jgi:hypothetical protein
VLAHLVHDAARGRETRCALRLGRNRERVHERLRVLFADACEELLREPAHGQHGGVDARDDLRDHLCNTVSGSHN